MDQLLSPVSVSHQTGQWLTNTLCGLLRQHHRVCTVYTSYTQSVYTYHSSDDVGEENVVGVATVYQLPLVWHHQGYLGFPPPRSRYVDNNNSQLFVRHEDSHYVANCTSSVDLSQPAVIQPSSTLQPSKSSPGIPGTSTFRMRLKNVLFDRAFNWFCWRSWTCRIAAPYKFCVDWLIDWFVKLFAQSTVLIFDLLWLTTRPIQTVCYCTVPIQPLAARY